MHRVTLAMSPILVMFSGIVIVMLLPALMSPGMSEDQNRVGGKRVDRKHKRHVLSDDQLNKVVERCVDFKLRATDLLLIAISILNLSVLFCVLGLHNELLLRVTIPGDAPPTYEEAIRANL